VSNVTENGTHQAGDLPPELVVDERPLPVPPLGASATDLWETVALVIRGRARAADSRKQTELDAERKQRSIFLSLLRVCDAFDRIERTTDVTRLDPAAQQRFRSVRLTATLLEDALEEEGVVAMYGLEGSLVDAHKHEVADVEIRTDCPHGTILEVRERGYEWRGKLLRRAKVIMSRNPETES
jgi:molecular chaperone GrpE (heat shock protein)